MNSTNKKIGYFGGSFNPPHIAHIKIAEYLLNNENLDCICFAPSYYTKHKNYDSRNSFKYRYEMTKLAIDDLINNKYDYRLNTNFNKFFISNIEEEYYNKYKDYTYTYEVLNYLREIDKLDNKSNEYIIIVGFDSIYNIKSWYNYEKLLKEYKFIVFDRNVDENDISYENKISLFIDLNNQYGFDYEYINTLDTNYISSTNIRNMFKEYYKVNNDKILEEISKYLNKEVINYIINNKLYKD